MIDAILQIIALASMVFFLPLPVFWIMLHSNIEHFRKHKMHALYAKIIMLIFSAVAVLSNYAELSRTIQLNLGLQILGILLLLLALVLTWKTSKLLGKDTLVGISEIRNEKKLVNKGIYSKIRHPRYLAVFIFLLSISLITGYIYMFLLFAYSVVMFYFVAVEEEKELNRRLGKKYKEYMKKTGRFLPKW